MAEQKKDVDKKYKYIILGVTVVLSFVSLYLGIDSFVKTLLGMIIGFLIGKEVNA